MTKEEFCGLAAKQMQSATIRWLKYPPSDCSQEAWDAWLEDVEVHLLDMNIKLSGHELPYLTGKSVTHPKLNRATSMWDLIAIKTPVRLIASPYRETVFMSTPEESEQLDGFEEMMLSVQYGFETQVNRSSRRVSVDGKYSTVCHPGVRWMNPLAQ